METINEVKLDFDSLNKMLMSSDKENATLAMSLLENINFKKNLVLILLLYKKTHHTPYTWLTAAPKVWLKMKSAGVSDTKPLTYKDILAIMQEKKVPADQVELFVQSVNDTLKNDLAQYGYDFIDKIEITLKPKTV